MAKESILVHQGDLSLLSRYTIAHLVGYSMVDFHRLAKNLVVHTKHSHQCRRGRQYLPTANCQNREAFQGTVDFREDVVMVHPKAKANLDNLGHSKDVPCPLKSRQVFGLAPNGHFAILILSTQGVVNYSPKRTECY